MKKKIRAKNILKDKEYLASRTKKAKRNEKEKALEVFAKKEIQESSHKKYKVNVVPKDEIDYMRLVLGVKPKLEDVVKITETTVTNKTKNPAKRKVEKRPKKSGSGLSRTHKSSEPTTKQITAIIISEKIKLNKETHSNNCIKEQKEKVEKRNARKEIGVINRSVASEKIEKKKEIAKSEFELKQKTELPSIPRKVRRDLSNGRVNGKKTSRAKDAITFVMDSPAKILVDVKNKKAGPKPKYRKNKDQKIKQVIVSEQRQQKAISIN